MSELKYWIADRLFTKELDDAFRLGVRAGIGHATSTVTFRVGLKRVQLTKTEEKGYNKALDSINDVRSELLSKYDENWTPC
jgi:hypothetical protein